MDIKVDFDTFPSSLFSTTTGDRASKARALALRGAVQAAADTWSSYLIDVFPEIPTGSIITVGNPTNGADLNSLFFQTQVLLANTAISGIVIFAASSYQFGAILGAKVNATTSTKQILESAPLGLDKEYIDARLRGINYQPFAASISFNEARKWSPGQANIAEDQNDIYLTSLHEIGHVLGFDDIPAFQRSVNGSTYSGVNTTQPLTDKVHLFPSTGNQLIVPDSIRGNIDAIMIDGGGGYNGSSAGEPSRGLTQVDLQILADMGYEVTQPAGTLASTTPLFTRTIIDGKIVYSLTVDPAWTATSFPKYNGIIAGNSGGFLVTGNDSITGNAENEFFAGGPGDDTLSGGVGNDSLYGGEGNDSLLGGPGDDLVYGGVGDDKLFSGGGRNVLTGAGQDTNGKYGFNEKDTLVRSAFSLRTTFVIGDSTNGNFYNNVDGFSSTNPTSDFDKDFAFIQGYTPGQDRIQVNFVNPISGSGYRAETFNGDTWIFDSSTSDLIAKVQGTSKEQITFIAFA